METSKEVLFHRLATARAYVSSSQRCSPGGGIVCPVTQPRSLLSTSFQLPSTDPNNVRSRQDKSYVRVAVG